MNEPEWVSTTLKELFEEPDAPPMRHPVIRSGERDPIPLLVRISVYLRDGGRCRECGLTYPEMELDHIVPWSAGGGDHSANLRLLCKTHNQERSNFRSDAEDRLPMPTTWWCWQCWRHPGIEVDDPDEMDWGARHEMWFRSVWKDGTDQAAAPRVTEPAEYVYCAKCRTYSLSNVLFSALMQAKLVELCVPTTALATARAAVHTATKEVI